MGVFDIIEVERNGRLWRLHWKNRYDPITLTVLALTATGIGTAVGIGQTLKQGKEAEKISKARAQIDLENAEAVRRQSVEEARIEKEKGRRLLATQKVTAAAGGIRINVGAPLVIEAETQADIAKEVGFILERGRAGEGAFRSSAAIEIAVGKSLRRRSKFDAISQGLLGFGAIAMGASSAGLFSKTPAITTTPAPGAGAGFGRPTHTGGFFA